MRNRFDVLSLYALLALALLATPAAIAQTYDLDWFTVAGGGGLSAAAGYEFHGTAGQFCADFAVSGGGYDLIGGFWPGVAASACPGDLTGDGRTDQSDLGVLLAFYGCTGGGCTGDLNGDGNTDQSDLGILLAFYGCAP
ncbi:MAG: hypothetical protein LC135_07910 [Phycisphaerae bacterium]|jgi:hypothetical protein|nr:hypothetical protein [Phycisphaerae bacterium]MCZ2399778.1 hypothetical protein [Phycisphaerae bacterium]